MARVKVDSEQKKKSAVATATKKDDQTAGRKRRPKSVIDAEKAARAEKKRVREEKKAALEKKRAERATKKAERDARRSAKEAAIKAKLDESNAAAGVQKVIDSLKIDTKKYCKAVPMTAKEREHIKKILALPDLKWTVVTQFYGKSDFNILEHRENELVIKVDDVYYFYNRTTDRGINFGSVFDTWLDTCKKTPWTDKAVNIEKEEKNGDNSTPRKQTRRTKKAAK